MRKALSALVLFCLVCLTCSAVDAQRIQSSRGNSKQEKTPVRYKKLAAFSDNRGVYIEWETELESNNLGFSVHRVGDAAKRPMDGRFISGAYFQSGEMISAGGKYSFFDADGDAASEYYIESISASGKTYNSPVVAATRVADLSKITGVDSDTLKSSAKTASPTRIQDENVLPSDLQSEVAAAQAAQSDPAKQLWVAAQPGVKIAIKKEGIYRITRQQLESAGFNVSAPSNLWQLYANGTEQPVSLGEDDDYIEFYGRGIDALEASAQTYYLVVGASGGKRIETTVRRSVGGRIIRGSYAQSVSKKERFFYINTVLNGEAENFFGSIVSQTENSVNVTLTGIDFSSANAKFDINIQGSTLVPHGTLVTVNNHELGIVAGNQRELSKATFDVPTAYLVEGTNVVKVRSQNGSGDVSLVESVKFAYNRKFQAQQNTLSFYTSNYRASYLENFTSPNVRVFDVTNSDNPILISNLKAEPNGGGGFRVFVPANRGRVMFAVEDSAILAAEPNAITANQPSDWASANHNADLIIVTHKNWTQQANDWAAYRRAQGFGVEVVDIEDIYDEFNFGILSATAINKFLKNASENWNTKPKYVLLIGDATYDPRNNQGGGANTFIPTKLVDTVYTETGSDDALVDFNDDGLAEMAIGRLPVRNAAQVTKLLGKVTAFEQTAENGLSRGAVFASDVPNGYDFAGLSERVRAQLPQSVNSVMVNRGEADARAKLLSEINNGRFLVNYSGHGTASAWVDGGFLAKQDFTGNAPTVTNANLSIFTMLTCLNGYFISADATANSDGLAEAMLKESNGAVASWASSGLTTPDVQEIMATRFYGQLGAGNFLRLGDLIKDAKTSIDGGRDVRLSWVLLGDPTLKIK